MQRYFFAYGVQLAIISFFTIIFIRLIVKRHLTFLRFNLASFYFFVDLGLLINFFYLPIKENPLVYILHFMAVYNVFFSVIFLLLFDLNLLYPQKKKYIYIMILIIHGAITYLILSFPNGILISANTGWKPVWSWQLLFSLYSYLSIILFILFYYNFNIYKMFKDNDLRKKWKYFMFGICGMSLYLYGVTLYNTWQNSFFGIIYSLMSICLLPFSYLIYESLGKNL